MKDFDVSILAALLQNSPDYVSGSKLAADLGVSRVSVWKRLELLEQQGFSFDAVRNKGYRIAATPRFLHEKLLRAYFHLYDLKAPLHFYDEIDSTNSQGQRLLASGVETPSLVIAQTQTQGRGRLGRRWYSQSQSTLCMSFLFSPKKSPTEMTKFTLWLAQALCLFLRNLCNQDIKIKWPNDIVLGEKKIAGILTEASIDADRIRNLVVGIGINVREQKEIPQEIKLRSRSIEEISGGAQDMNQAAAAISKTILDAYDEFIRDEYHNTFNANWEKMDALRGKDIRVSRHNNVISGVATGIDSEGALVLNQKNGEKIALTGGDITLLKDSLL